MENEKVIGRILKRSNVRGMTLSVVFLHPDLGIGGAEKLIVDAAVALKQKGHDVKIITAHFDIDRCFGELKSNGFLGSETVLLCGGFLPRHIFNRFHLLCTLVRMAWCTLWVPKSGVDVIICDQTSHIIPLLQLYHLPVLFYCHFPDLLLCVDRKNIFKQAYRYVLDILEERTTLMADIILVNSLFTRETFKKTFRSYNDNGNKDLLVLYPAYKGKLSLVSDTSERTDFVILSINRFERKKKLELVLESFYKFHELLDDGNSARLIIAGGYDVRVEENVSYFKDLQLRVRNLFGDSSNKVVFKRSFNDEEKEQLFEQASVLVYSPENEHFGIVPIEAMAHGVPVLAANSGGPKETIIHGKTGFLLPAESHEFAMKLKLLFEDRSLLNQMQVNARKHADDNFSFDTFATKLDIQVKKAASMKNRVGVLRNFISIFFLSLLIALAIYLVY